MLVTFRKAVATYLEGADILPLHEFVPADIAELPCAVVSMPDLDDGEEQGTFDISLGLYVVGRPVDADDAQIELAQHADSVIAAFGGTRGIKAGHHHMAVTSAISELRTVSGIELPTYRITITTSQATC